MLSQGASSSVQATPEKVSITPTFGFTSTESEALKFGHTTRLLLKKMAFVQYSCSSHKWI
jgi:hypothetical protein